MSIISRLSVILGLDTAEFNAGLGKAEQGVNKFGAMSGAMKAGIIAAGAAFVATSKQAIDFADAINDVAKANEMTVGKVLEFSQALSISGGKADDVSKIFASFTNKIDDAASGSQDMRDKFAKLGVTLKDIERLDESQLFDKTLKGLAQIEDPIKRNAMAMELLGKGIKGVDIKGLNEEFQRINGTMGASDEAFAKIGDAIDNLDKLSFKIKTDMANNIAEPVSVAVKVLEKFYETAKNGNGILDDSAKHLEKFGLTWRSIFFSTATQTMEMGKIFAQIQGKGGVADTSHYTPMNDWYQNNPVVPDLLRSQQGGSKRQIEATKEQLAAEEKLRKEKESQALALEQLIRNTKLQTSELGGTASTAEKLKIEFQKGGQYAAQANSELAKQAILAAEAYDKQKAQVEAQKEAVQQAIRKNDIEMQDRAERAQDAANQAIQRANFDYEFSKRLESVELQRQRSKLEQEMAGQSDTQRDKLLAIFDMEREIVRLKERNYFISEEQVQAYREANIALIEQEEVTRRTQNSFSAGWSRAYENFKERANDSAMMGARAFETMSSSMNRAIDNFVRTGKLSFKDLIGSMIQDLARLAMQAQASKIFQMLGGGFGGGGGFGSWLGETFGMTGFGGYLSGLFFADGGTPPVGQASIVGERGPELFVPRTSGTIIPNNQLSSMFNQQPQVVYNGPYIANMNAMDTQSAAQFLAKNKDAVWAANQSAARGLPMGRA